MGFTFKQFHIDDDCCAMKVGTDSILLGSMVDVSDVNTVLDIGSGSGLLGLMMAQLTQGNGRVTCVEIDSKACEQAKLNFSRSPWPDALIAVNQDINDFNPDQAFDVVVSNPPYFVDSLHSPDNARTTARHTTELSLTQLAKTAERLMTENGRFWLILPSDIANNFVSLAQKHQLHLQQLVRVHTKAGKPVRRHIMAFAKFNTQLVAQSDIAVYDENNQYSRQFIALTQNFYLNR